MDFPLIKTETIDRLAERFLVAKPLILIPSFQGQKGHPPFFNTALKKEILALPDDVGLNMISRLHEQDVCDFEVADQGVLLSFNTPQELQNLELILHSRPHPDELFG